MSNPNKELVLDAIGIVLGNRLVSMPSYLTDNEKIYQAMIGRRYLGSERESLTRGEGIADLRGMTAVLLWKREKLKLSSPKVAEMVGYNSHASVVEARDRHMEKLSSIIERLNLEPRVQKVKKIRKVKKVDKKHRKPQGSRKVHEIIPPLRQTTPLYDDGNDYIPWSPRDLTQSFYRTKI